MSSRSLLGHFRARCRLFPSWVTRKSHLLLIEDDNWLALTALDCDTDDLTRPLRQSGPMVTIFPSSESAEGPALVDRMHDLQSYNRAYNRARAWLLWHSWLATSLAFMAEVIALTSLPPSLQTRTIYFIAFLITLLIVFEFYRRNFVHRLRGSAEAVTEGPLTLRGIDQVARIADHEIPFREIRMFAVITFCGFETRWKDFQYYGGYYGTSFGIEMSTIRGSFVVGFVAGKQPCVQVVARLNAYLETARRRLACEGPPALPQPFERLMELTDDIMKMYAACSQLSDGASQTKLQRQMCCIRLRLCSAFGNFSVFFGIMGTAITAVGGICHGLKAVTWWEWMSQTVFWLYMAFLAIMDNLLWAFVNGILPKRLFCFLLIGRFTMPRGCSIHLFPVPRDYFYIFDSKAPVGVDVKGRYTLQLHTEDGRGHCLAWGLKEIEAVTAAGTLKEKLPMWFVDHAETNAVAQ